VGCRFSEVGTGSYGLEMPGPLIHVDIDPEVHGRNYEPELEVTADARSFLAAVVQGLGATPIEPDDGLRTRIRRGHEKAVEGWKARVGGERVTPFHLLRTLQEVLGPDTVYTTDSGNGTFLAMEQLRLNRPRSFLAPVDYSCMGYSVPAAIGAKMASPDRPVVALAGDGAFLMTGLDLITAAAQAVRVLVFALRARELAQIAQFQSTAMNRKVASELPDYDLAGFAAGAGLDFLHMENDAEVADVVKEAATLSGAGRPVLIDVEIDYSEKTYFTKGVVRTTLGRLPLKDRIRFIGRALVRRVTG